MKHLGGAAVLAILATLGARATERLPDDNYAATLMQESSCFEGSCDHADDPPASKAAFFGEELDRVDKDDPSYSPLGVLSNTRLGGLGTAFLISQCHILTNYHVLYDYDLPDDRRFNFNIGDSASANFLMAIEATPVLFGNFARTNSACEDFAVLELKQCIGDRFGFVKVGPLSIDQVLALQRPPYNKVVSGAGFHGSEDFTKVSVDRACTIEGLHIYDSESYAHTCGSTDGSSGGFLSFDLHGKPVAFAMMNMVMTTTDGQITPDTHFQSVDEADPKHLNMAVPISCIFDRIKQYIPKDPPAAVRGGPGP